MIIWSKTSQTPKNRSFHHQLHTAVLNLKRLLPHHYYISNDIFIHSFIHYLWQLILCRVAGGLEPIPADIGRGRGSTWTSGQFITGLTHRDKQPITLTFTPMDNLESLINLCVFGLWEEARVPGENPRRHGKQIKIPHRELLLQLWVENRRTWIQTQATALYIQTQATMLTTSPPCCPSDVIRRA